MGSIGYDLTFEILDDLALAAVRNRGDPVNHLRAYRVNRLGPLLELLALSRSAILPLDVLPTCAARQTMARALGIRQVSSGEHSIGQETRVGFILTNRDPHADDQTHWVAFCRKAQEVAELSLPKSVAQGMVGAMREIEENIHVHSERSFDGVVGYRGTGNEFEFAVADSGIGLLNSLKKSSDYAQLADSGSAIKIALADGHSRLRHLNPGRGYGFHDLFVGLANLNGELRFRSGDHALVINGASPSLMTARLSQKVDIGGFLVSIVCRLTPALVLH
jgi:hypothetical protein